LGGRKRGMAEDKYELRQKSDEELFVFIAG
jgi:hypothetical protein